MEEVMRQSQHPLDYQPPQQVFFMGSLGNFNRDHLTLHGLASQKCDARPGEENSDEAPDCYLGYPATCELTVEKRGSKADLAKWMDARLGIPPDLAKKVGESQK